MAGKTRYQLLQDSVEETRKALDWPFAIALWVASCALIVVLCATVAKEFGWTTKLIPTMNYLNLVYAAGIVWLLRR